MGQRRSTRALLSAFCCFHAASLPACAIGADLGEEGDTSLQTTDGTVLTTTPVDTDSGTLGTQTTDQTASTTTSGSTTTQSDSSDSASQSTSSTSIGDSTGETSSDTNQTTSTTTDSTSTTSDETSTTGSSTSETSTSTQDTDSSTSSNSTSDQTTSACGTRPNFGAYAECAVDTKPCSPPFECLEKTDGTTVLDGLCTESCFFDSDCSGFLNCAAEPTCLMSKIGMYCFLVCETNADCPSGMECSDVTVNDVAAKVCD